MTSFRGCRVLNARGTGMLSCKKNLMVQGNDTKLLLFFVCNSQYLENVGGFWFVFCFRSCGCYCVKYWDHAV